MTLRSNALFAAIACAAIAPAAYAETAIPQVRQHYSFDGQRVVAELTVPYADLDITSASGARALLQRIEAAADAVCGGGAALPTYRDCRRAAVARALARMKSPALARVASETRSWSAGR